MAKLTVYICREPAHEKLIEMVKDVRSRVKGKKPKLRVVRLKLDRGEDFSALLNRLEDLFGGVATAEFRRYGIKSLPAIVYNDQLVLQGSIPSLEELEEALAYAGLKFVRERPVAAQPPVQLLLPQQSPSEKPASSPHQLSSVKVGEDTQAKKTPPPKIDILGKLSPPVEGDKGPRAEEQKARAVEAVSSLRKPSEVPKHVVQPDLKPVPQDHSIRAPRLHEKPQPSLEPTLKPSAEDLIKQEELLVNVPPTESIRSHAKARKLCRNCLFYESSTKRCLLYRAPVTNPDNPLCA